MKKRKSNNPDGRPSKGLSEASVLVVAPRALLEAASAAAQRDGISVREWWRRAALAYLQQTER